MAGDRRLMAAPVSSCAINVEAITADMRDGLLQITLVKAPEAQMRKISVQAR